MLKSALIILSSRQGETQIRPEAHDKEKNIVLSHKEITLSLLKKCSVNAINYENIRIEFLVRVFAGDALSRAIQGKSDQGV